MSPKSTTTALIYIQFMRTDIQTTLQTLLNTNTYSNMRGNFFPFPTRHHQVPKKAGIYYKNNNIPNP